MNDVRLSRETFDEYMVPAYAPASFFIERGEGARLQDTEAQACILVLGKVHAFAQSSFVDYCDADQGVRRLMSGERVEAAAPMPHVFSVVDHLTKQSK
ncbi:hypothetical protein C7405_102242 [Paraburkholderia caballeronis]|uniref:hypothetical protein n=1 Tax=Paraburkholderia caballeronis TaxID=416943 RepID=UPI0010656325|nr:hypothetical protein [Paraburkholderia caballeronis]TDV38042.1 hypothetical protein C7405_102242 [Paraburkholderia caballeronis]